VIWNRTHGKTADLSHAAGGRSSDLQVAIGVRLWW
jgi:uncharacterized protein involved in copper resistance